MSMTKAFPAASDGSVFFANHCAELHHLWNTRTRQNGTSSFYNRLLDSELISAQFFADYQAYDRLLYVATKRLKEEAGQPDAYLFAAKVFSSTHRFSDASIALKQAQSMGCSEDVARSIQLALDQAMGQNIDALIDERRAMCKENPNISNLLALGGLSASLGEYKEAENLFTSAFSVNANLSPLGYAWASFQLGILFAETIDKPDLEQAKSWYTRALDYLPSYTAAAIHLAEIKIGEGDYSEAETLLQSVEKSGEPEVFWRSAELKQKTGQSMDATASLQSAYKMYLDLLSRHQLAFADHATEFLIETDLDYQLALELAFVNLDNRKTKRAYELVYQASVHAAQHELTSI